MRLTKRDKGVIGLVYQQRYLRSDQILALSQAFDKPLSEQMLWRRLRFLREHDYLNRLPKRHHAKMVYYLTKRGAELIAAEQGVVLEEVGYPVDPGETSEYFLEHTLRIADFRVALTLACHDTQGSQKRKQSIKFIDWVSEAELRRQNVQVQVPGRAKRLPLRPDGFARIRNPAGTRMQCFVEIDMGTERLAVFTRKVQAYMHYQSGDQHFKAYLADLPCKVLTVTSSDARMENLLLATQEQGGGAEFCFTTYEKLSPESILDSVWQAAGSGAQLVKESADQGNSARDRTHALGPTSDGRLGEQHASDSAAPGVSSPSSLVLDQINRTFAPYIRGSCVDPSLSSDRAPLAEPDAPWRHAHADTAW